MVQGEFVAPADMRGLYDSVVVTYQRGFGQGSIWGEESLCAADLAAVERCESGFSPQSVGEVCLRCGNCLVRPAYERDALIERFETLAATRPTAWYVERDDQERLTMAALAWRADVETIAAERYNDVPTMAEWLRANLRGPIVWVDEVFANLAISPNGNLRNFGTFVAGLARQLGATTVAYRTIEPRMTAAALRDFGERAQVLPRKAGVPDRRDFVLIDLSEEEEQ